MFTNHLRRAIVLIWFTAGFVFVSFFLPPAAVAGKTVESIPETLQSASELDYPPFAVVRADGAADGFSVDLLKAVTRAVGLDVRLHTGPWHVIKQELADGRIDVLPFVSYSQERDIIFDFTAPYLRLHGTVFVRKGETSIRDEADLKGREIIVMRGDTAHEYALANKLSDKLVLTDSYEEALRLLSRGRHDAVILQQIVGLQLLKKLDIDNVVDIHKPQETDLKPRARPLSGFEQKFCMAVKNNNRRLLALLNEGLAVVIADGTYDDLYRKWFAPILPTPPIQPMMMLKQLFYTTAPIIFIVILAGFWYLKKQVKNKTASLRTEIRERQQAEIALRDSEAKFRAIAENIGEAIWQLDMDGRIIYTSPTAQSLLGYSPETVTGKQLTDLFVETDARAFEKAFAEAVSGRKYQLLELKATPKDRNPIPVEISIAPIMRAGSPAGIQCIGRDITERVNAAEAMRWNEAFLDSLLEAIPIPVFYKDRQGRYLGFNKAYEDFFGKIQDQWTGKTVDEIHPPELARTYRIMDDALFASGGVQQYESEVRDADNNRRQVIFNKAVFTDREGRVNGLVGTILDITEQKTAARLLAESEIKFRAIFDYANDGILLGAAGTRKLVMANHMICNMLGYTREEISHLSVDDIHPADALPEINQAFERQLRKEIRISEDVPVKRKDGSIFYADINSTPLEIEGKQYLLGIFRDITDRKRARETLSRQEAELRATLYGIGEAVIAADTQGRVARMNPAAQHLTGWNEAQAFGRPLEAIVRIIDEETRWPEENPVDRVLREKAVVRPSRETLLVARDGREIPTFYSAAPILDNRDTVIGVVLVLRDQTEERLIRRFNETRLSLIHYAVDHNLDALLTRALDAVGDFVESPIGFYHFVEPDQKTLSLQQWSSRTLHEFCQARGRGQHYPVDQAGVWVDCVRERKPIIHNDMTSLPHKKGMPEGHAEVVRELVVPVMRNDAIVAILGVGNKPTPYTDHDLEIVNYFADVTWEIVRQKRGEMEISRQKDIESEFSNLSAFLLTTTGLAALSNNVLETAKKLTKSRYGFAGSIDPESGSLVSHTMTRDIWEECNIPDKSIVFDQHKGLWGWAITKREPILVNEPATDARSGDTPPGHVTIDAFLGVPAMIGDDVVGLLALANPDAPYTESDLEVVQRLTNIYSMAIQRHKYETALVEAEVRKSAELEKMVQTRTAELSESKALVEKNWNLLQMVFDGISEPLVLLQKDGAVSMMNKAAAAYYDTSIQDAIRGEPCYQALMKKPRVCAGCDILQHIAEGRHTAYEREGLMDPDRTEQVVIYPLELKQDETASAIIRICDITTEKQMERELAQADKMISLGILVSGVAHEINNPNNFIMLNAPLLKDVWDSILPILDRYQTAHGDFSTAGLPYSEMKAEVPNLLNGIQEGSKRIQRIVRDLKDYARRDMGHMDERAQINDIVRQAVALLKSLIKKSTTAFKVSYDANAPEIEGNRQKLEQVVINLIQNACEALPDMQKGIAVSTAYNANSRQVVVRVSDEGLGIPEDALPHIMDPFFTTRRDTGGTGLGLSVSSNIVREHGGKIEVRSAQGEGSVFQVLLPVKRRKVIKKILVVDDDPNVREMIVRALATDERYIVEALSNGTEASIKLGMEQPDLVILDMQMPDINGTEICRMIKTNPVLAKIRVIIITGFASAPEVAKAAGMGCDTILPKPFKVHDLLNLVNDMLT